MRYDADVPTASSMMHRRKFLVAASTSLLCAPTIVRASSLMPVKVMEYAPLAPPSDETQSIERPLAGLCERLAYQSMDHVIRTGWTPEKAAGIYGGMSEDDMRRAVAYARWHGLLK